MSNEEKTKSVSAWPFGDDADYLAQLVIDGVKTATCSGLVFYELENEPLPAVGDYSIVLNSKDEPVAIIQTIDVQVIPMNEVPEDFSIKEDRTSQFWWAAHERFFIEELTNHGLEFSADLPLVRERFTLIDVQDR